MPGLPGIQATTKAAAPTQLPLITWQMYRWVGDVVLVSRDHAEQIAADLALRYWTPGAAQLPWVKHAYPH
jgi:hypothetical protein